MYGYGSKACGGSPLKEIRVPAAQRIMTRRSEDEGPRTMMLRMRSRLARRAQSSSRLRTRGAGPNVGQPLYSLSIIPLEIDGIRNPRRGYTTRESSNALQEVTRTSDACRVEKELGIIIVEYAVERRSLRVLRTSGSTANPISTSPLGRIPGASALFTARPPSDLVRRDRPRNDVDEPVRDHAEPESRGGRLGEYS